ncbi:hypothetical protein [Xanthocytophaga agilis]|uniref:Uncharacterized protein n=1 Tax=Xanthocytophaga agilis TaxID=3048010 RepID=A0AAE3UF76_9BACT|nr:hypothetical protein [Xanthocytophaga agilis]MDJ1500268.1 hypothetical protein [Xanthocytophaga agilis]
MKPYILFSIINLVCTVWVLAQNPVLEPPQPTNNTAEKPLEFSIPVSAAFDLLGVNPASVMKPGNIRDIKVDWSFRSWRLRPNIAIQAQPIWEIFYNRPHLTRYQRANRFSKMLSTLDLSFGTVEDENQNRRLAMATKLTLFRSKDPLDQPDLYNNLTEEFYQQRVELEKTLQLLHDSLTHTPKESDLLPTRFKIQEQITSIQQQLLTMDQTQRQRIQELATLFVKENWNASFLDIAFGKAYTFQNPVLDSLKLAEDGWSVWTNGSVGIGRRLLLSGLVRYTEFTKDTLHQDRPIKQYTMGINLRYGSPRFNFFVEMINQKIDLPIRQDTFTIAYGGDWRFSRNVMISYAVRTIYNRKFTFQNLIPIASISCMMR